MTVINTGISWTTSTWNLAIGCNKVSAGCDNCYAEYMVNRLASFGQRFEDVKLRLERLSHVKRFRPVDDGNGGVTPHLVFVNSMSDFWHDAIPDDVIHHVLDVMERHPDICFQTLSKRSIRARRILVGRYGGKGIPTHMWMGVSAEDNRVAKRLDIWRSVRDRTGGGTFFVSVEPIVGPTNHLDFAEMDWVITGGESGPRARKMERGWLMPAVEATQRAGIALWHKQSGTTRSHPNIDQVPATVSAKEQFYWLRRHGWEVLPHEKGGATIDRQTYRQMPPAYHALTAAMNQDLLSA